MLAANNNNPQKLGNDISTEIFSASNDNGKINVQVTVLVGEFYNLFFFFVLFMIFFCLFIFCCTHQLYVCVIPSLCLTLILHSVILYAPQNPVIMHLLRNVVTNFSLCVCASLFCLKNVLLLFA